MSKKGARGRGQASEVVVVNANKSFRINESFIKKIAEHTLKILRKTGAKKLDIVFLSDPAIRQLNKRYKNRNSATDVLSFDLGSFGQILISSDTALKNSARFKSSFEEELVLYVIHGILHLFGYDDTTDAAKRMMSDKEERLLERLCEKLSFSKVLMSR